MLAKLKEIRKNKKGFTLVELIVVLVILAILAALLIPALTGYIDKAKDKQIVAETRQAVMAAQTIVDEQLATKETTELGNFDGTLVVPDAAGTDSTLIEETAILGEVTETNITSITGADAKITELVYEKNGKTCTYDGTTYKVTK